MHSSCGKSEEPYAPLIKYHSNVYNGKTLCCADSCKQYLTEFTRLLAG